MSLAIVVILAATSLLQPLIAPATARSRGEVTVVFSAAVVVYDPSHTIIRQAHEWFNTTIESSNCVIRLNVNTTFTYAPRWALQDLEDWLEKHYEQRGVPKWAEKYVEKHGLRVKWVKLKEFYDYLWSLTSAVLSSMNISASDVTVIIGNIDNVSRQYYEEPLRFIHVDPLEGVRGWAGGKPMAFYDLSTIPEPWPAKRIPFYGTGIPVNISTEPPIWSLSTARFWSYVEGLVRDHLRYHYLTIMCSEASYIENLHVEILVLDYGNETATRMILGMLNTTLLSSILGAMDPWTNYTIRLRVLNALGDPVLSSILREGARSAGGWLVLDTNTVLEKLSEYENLHPLKNQCKYRLLQRELVVENCSYPVYILATPKPSYFQFTGSNFNFTGMYAGDLIVFSFPGYGNRLLHGGLVRAIAHEIGHFRGLGHPFQLQLRQPSGRVETRWLMDFVLSPMSYYDPAFSAYRPGDAFYYDMARRALLVIAALAEKQGAQGLSIHGSPVDAAKTLLPVIKAMLARRGTAATTTTTRECQNTTITTTLTNTITNTITRTVKETITVTSTARTTATTTLEKTLTTTYTTTHTVTGEEKTTTIVKTETQTVTTTIAAAAQPKTTTTGALIAWILIALLTGLAIGYSAATARKH